MNTRDFFKVAVLGLFTVVLPRASAAVAGQDLADMLATSAAAQATAVSGPVIMVSPLSLDFGVVNNGTSRTLTLTITNIGDQDLQIASYTFGDPTYTTSSPTPLIPHGVGGNPGGHADVVVRFSPDDGQSHPGTMMIASNASNGTQTVNLAGQANAAPTLNAIGDKTVTAFTALAFTVTATDANDTLDDALTFSMSAGLPPSATFDSTTGEFSWTPSSADAGTYTVTFSVSDGRATDSEVVHIAVTVTNHPPTASAGGTYFGATNRPLQFRSTGSFDPDAGQTLTYTWSFGDGATGTGASPLHTYLAPGSYVAGLTVCDNGTPQLCDDDFASVTIQTEVGAQIILNNSGTVLLATNSGGGNFQTLGIEEILVSYTDLIQSTLRISTTTPNAGTVSECTFDPRFFRFGDMDIDGVTDFDVRVANSCLNKLFKNVPNLSAHTIVITGQFTSPGGTIPLRGERIATIRNNSGGQCGGQCVAALASPNPFNPEAAIAYTVGSNGPVTMRIYSVDGRLVRTLKNGEETEAGTHEVRWNGTNEQGRHVPSGIYFVKTSQNVGGAEESSVFKLAAMK